MTPIEFRTRRKALCLNQEEIGRCIALVSPMADGTDRPAIRQATIARWERERGLPEWADMEMLSIFRKLDITLQLMQDDAARIGTIAIAMYSPMSVAPIPAYADDETLWREQPQWAGWPAALWNLAALRAADTLADQKHRDIQLTESE